MLIDFRLQTPEFQIIDETEDFIVVNKPSHFLVHPGNPDGPPTLFCELKDLLMFEIANGGQISIITRLDRETSGVVLVAKTKEMAQTLAKAIQNHEFTKTYEAIIWGWPEADEFENDQPTIRQREVEPSAVWVKQFVHPDGKPSHTRFRVLKRFEKETTAGNRFSLVECEPITGRMHQIRLHLADLGFPVVGDKLYLDERNYLEFIETSWTQELEDRLLLNRQALHASKLEWRDFSWEAPLPPALSDFVNVPY